MLLQVPCEAENWSQEFGVQVARVQGNLGLPGSGRPMDIAEAHVKEFEG
jgi:hypothetical protein